LGVPLEGGDEMRRGALILLAVVGLAAPGSAVPADPNDLLLVSASVAGAGGNGESFGPSLSADGRLVAFSSTATNLHPADTDAEFDVYVKDLATGAVTLVSRAADGTKANARTTGGAISADGTRVALSTGATNLHPSGSPGAYVKDLVSDQVIPVSTTATGVQANAGAGSLSLSADGTRVAFTTTATNLDPRDPVDDFDAYVKDLVTGQLMLVSLSASGEKKLGLFGAPVATISADGSHVAFHSDAAGLTPNDPDDTGDVFVRELSTGKLTLASTNDAGVKGNAQSNTPALSTDGSKVAFGSFATNLDPDMTISGSGSVYLKDLASGDISLVSRTSAGAPIPGGGFGLSLSADATRVAFASLSAFADPADTDTVSDIYVKDIASGALFLASTTKTGVKGNGPSFPAALAPDGRTVGFRSDATNLHPADTDSSADVFAKVLGGAPPPPPTGSADLAVSQSDSPDPVLAGGQLTYDVRVRNDGPAAATAVTVLDELDALVRFESAAPSRGTCTHVAGVVRCDLGAMAAGETASITVRVTPLQQGNVRARATVQGPEPDPDAADNTSSALTTVQAAADFSVTLTDTPDPVRVRAPLTHRAEVANDGPSNGAANLSATLPTEVRLVSVTASGGGDCRVDRRTVICFFAGIDPGQRVAATIATSPKQAGPLTVSASVSPFLVTDPMPGNNTDSETTSVVR
jgi:uncharacterized repeat protein (TIGR01451 family)